ncbi:hypothetical protein QZH41_020254, partial [Actinostola sp. cb2023]
MDVRPEDSVSNISSRHGSKTSSRRSRSSSVRSSAVSDARAMAAAKKAILGAEAATLQRLHQIEEEELRLRQRKKELKLQTEMAKAEAEELAYAQAEQRETAGNTRSAFLDEGYKLRFTVPPPMVEDTQGSPAAVVPDATPRRPLDPPKDESTAIKPQPHMYGPRPPMVDNPLILCPQVSETPLTSQHTKSTNAHKWKYDTSQQPSQNPSASNTRYASTSPLALQHPPYQTNDYIQQMMLQQQEAIMSLTLPQPELPVFSGDPVEYCDFIRAFENLIERKTRNPSSRLYYLLQYTAGQVQDLVRSCLAMREETGYTEARKLLAERYGQPYKIATAYVDRVINGQPIRTEDGPALQKFSILLTSCNNTLKEIGYLSRLENPESLRKIVDRLPYSLKLKWREAADSITQKGKRDPTLKDMTEFVEARSRVANHPIFGKISSNLQRSSNLNSNKQRRGAVSFAAEANPQQPQPRNAERKRVKCPSCDKDHWLSQCDDFKKLNLQDRYKLVRAKRLCLNCLVSGHFVHECPKKSFCRIQDCTKKHSTFLHDKEQKETQPKASHVNTTDANNGASNTGESAATNGYVKTETFQTSKSSSVVGFSIVPVEVNAMGQDKKVLTYAFLDSGSNTSFCTKELMRKLDVKGKATSLSLTTMQIANKQIECSLVSLEVTNLSNSNRVKLPMVYSRSSLPVSTDTIGTQEDVDRWPHLKGIKIPSIEAEIGLLIGSDAPQILQPKEVRESDNGGPYATRTVLGWVLNGPLGREKNKAATANFVDSDTELSKQFSEYCNLEFNDSTYEPKTSMSQNDRRALEIMQTTTVKLEDNHYEIALPWKNDPPCLHDNKSQAERRLELLKKRLQKDPVVLEKYKDFMDNILSKNHARKLSSKDLAQTAEAWYLPHHPVFHPQKPGKARVVFDCSAKYRGSSLNDQLLQGPDLTNTLIGVLTRFRQEQVAFMSDIEAMFYQVRVRPSDCKYLRFLWWPDGNMEREPQKYQMSVHLFGGASSPSCAIYALKKTAEDNKDYFDQETVQTAKGNFYVDDCLRSIATAPEAVRLVSQLRELLSKGGFHLTKWISNSKEVIDSVPASERAASVKDLDTGNRSRRISEPPTVIRIPTSGFIYDVSESFRLPKKGEGSTFWTDSTCVLRYIENKDKRFQTFVANRAAAILDQSTETQWKYVETSLNPADEASRGMTVDAFLHNKRWTDGPDFLKQSEETWPQRPPDMGQIPNDDPEVKKTIEVFAIEVSNDSDYISKVLEKFSSWTRLKKIIAWVLCYKNNLRKQSQRRKANEVISCQSKVNANIPLSVSEINDAERVIVKYVQKQAFKEELSILNCIDKENQESSNQSTVKKCSSIYKLDPIMTDSLLRVGGRLQRAPIENDAKHPIILPKKHHVVKLIIDYYHRASAHSGIEYTLSLIRQKYWIIAARSSVRNAVNTCFDCRRRQAPVMQQKMASLPQNRTTPCKPPFTYVGVDCFGPFTVRRGRTTAKRYGVLFTCLTTRAIHIEVAYSMDTESFINSLRRFVSRRGQPDEIRSDNGGNFVKGEKELRMAIQDWNQTQIHEYLLQHNVKWIFNPPAASHHGGVWERCIRTVRKVMKALLKQQVLDDEGLNTLMCEVESIVNGRLITKVSDDPKDLDALTPNHLLLLRAGTATPPGVFSKDDNYTRRRWRQVQYLSNLFWLRWTKEYLPSLQQRQKWNKPQRNLAVNNIVLLLDENTPRSAWPLGIVLEVYSNSKD